MPGRDLAVVKFIDAAQKVAVLGCNDDWRGRSGGGGLFYFGGELYGILFLC